MLKKIPLEMILIVVAFFAVFAIGMVAKDKGVEMEQQKPSMSVNIKPGLNYIPGMVKLEKGGSFCTKLGDLKFCDQPKKQM